MSESFVRNDRLAESVWDYPRPPRLERSSLHVTVEFGGQVIADSTGAYRVLETSHPPVFYIPIADVLEGCLEKGSRRSHCEWKGSAVYFSIVLEEVRADNAAWGYPVANARFAEIQDCIAFYPSLMDECRVEGEVVRSQPGDFYGGWITSEIEGPFKGDRGTEGW